MKASWDSSRPSVSTLFSNTTCQNPKFSQKFKIFELTIYPNVQSDGRDRRLKHRSLAVREETKVSPQPLNDRLIFLPPER